MINGMGCAIRSARFCQRLAPTLAAVPTDHHLSFRPFSSSASTSTSAPLSSASLSSSTSFEHEQKSVRVSKRMSELGLASRREADALIKEGRVLVDDKVAVLGQKIPSSFADIRIVARSAAASFDDDQQEQQQELDLNVDMSVDMEDHLEAVVLNKPNGYVSSQPEHGHTPAIKLLTADRHWADPDDPARWDPSELEWKRRPFHGYAPCGRLDRNSNGLLIFSKSGALARKLVTEHAIEKEYLVDLDPAVQPSRLEREEHGIEALPFPTKNLSVLRNGGAWLAGDTRPLLPCGAKWVVYERNGPCLLRLTLHEGRKHQIRRMCREILGWHVVNLTRVRIGVIEIDDLPLGKWRPLTSQEVDAIKQGK